jgi:DNA-binding MarR family transcriptional regulator
MRRWILQIFLLAALASAGVVNPARGQNDSGVLVYGITGSESGSYSSAMSRVAVQKLLLDLAATPRKPEFLDVALNGSGISRADLEQLGLVHRQGDNYIINFYLMTKTDELKVRQVTEAHARSLAAAFLARRQEIEAAIQPYQLKGVEPKAVAYILVGCFVLDWDGLNITAEKGYRSEATTRPNGDRYTPWARERSDLTLKGLFWGSHNDYEPEVVFTSFGDHFAVPRYALPDLLTSAPSRVTRPEMSISLKRKLSRVVEQSLKITNQRLGHMMLLLREGEKSLDELAQAAGLKPNEATDPLALLAELGYIEQEGGRYHALVPVFTEREKGMVQRVLRIGRQVMDEWLAANYDQIKAELSDISPVRFGVPYNQGFTQIWHYIFGSANRQLVEAGFFANPYAESRRYKGFIPVVWHPSLDPDVLGKSPA